MHDQLNLFCFAGTDTSSAAFDWGLAKLALTPDIQDKNRAEMNDVLGAESEPPTYRDLPKLKYLGAFLKELLRVYSPARAVYRKFTSDETMELNGVPIPPNSTIAIEVQAINLSEDYFPRPMEFLPERCLTTTESNLLPVASPEGLLTFSFGFRSCIGRPFAMVELQTLIPSVLRAYLVVPTPTERVARRLL